MFENFVFADLLMNSPYYRYLRTNALSPVRYYPTYGDCYGERSWSPTRSQVIHNRVERALRRDRSLEHLDRFSCYPYTVCSVLFALGQFLISFFFVLQNIAWNDGKSS